MARRTDNVARFNTRRRRWRTPRAPQPARFARPRKSWGQALRDTRPFTLLVALVTLAVIAYDGALLEPPAFLQTDPETVSATFTRCGRGRGHHCVVDGDTFKIGERKVRVVGIDTPEVAARCPAEAAAAERATQALQAWLNRGPFRMTARLDEPADRYGRDLRMLKRTAPGGGEDHLADHMREGGWARRYMGGWRGGWC